MNSWARAKTAAKDKKQLFKRQTRDEQLGKALAKTAAKDKKQKETN